MSCLEVDCKAILSPEKARNPLSREQSLINGHDPYMAGAVSDR